MKRLDWITPLERRILFLSATFIWNAIFFRFIVPPIRVFGFELPMWQLAVCIAGLCLALFSLSLLTKDGPQDEWNAKEEVRKWQEQS